MTGSEWSGVGIGSMRRFEGRPPGGPPLPRVPSGWLILAAALLLSAGCPDEDGEPDARGRVARDVGMSEDALAIEYCVNRVDDDGDGLVDCQDDDCDEHPNCVARTEICTNDDDDDGDGDVDCFDADCIDDPECSDRFEQCDNGDDDDGDGYVDCRDTDCSAHSACLPSCGNGRLDEGEDCDGAQIGSCDMVTESCYADCRCGPRCGNGDLDDGEECDGRQLGVCDPATQDCDEDCSCRDFCGNGVLDAGETCDGEHLGSCQEGLEYCDADCVCALLCGDGQVTQGEGCDFDTLGAAFGDCIGGDTPLCDPVSCQCVDAVCGDGAVDGDEDCDVDPDSGQASGCDAVTPVCVDCLCEADACSDDLVPFQLANDVLFPDSVELALPARDSAYADCSGADGPELLLEFTAPDDDLYRFAARVTGDAAGTPGLALSLRTLCHPAVEPKACSADETGRYSVADLVISTDDTVFLVVDSPDAAWAGRSIEIWWGPPWMGLLGDGCGGPFALCSEGLVCVGTRCETDVCPAGATVIEEVSPVAPGETRWSLIGTLPEDLSRYGDCAAAGPELLVAWEVPETGTYAFSTDNELTQSAGTEITLALRRHCHAGALAEHCGGGGDGLLVELESGQQWWIVVDSPSGGEAGRNFQLAWERVE